MLGISLSNSIVDNVWVSLIRVKVTVSSLLQGNHWERHYESVFLCPLRGSSLHIPKHLLAWKRLIQL